jgi:DNA processing protein
MGETGRPGRPQDRGMTEAVRPTDFARWLGRLRDPADRDPAGIERDLAWLEAPNRTLLTAEDPRYPPQLAAVRGMPSALFVEGDPAVLSRPQVAIVGSRAATAAGREAAFDFAARLAAAGFAITSGLATGIDGQAHRGALAARGATIAVCGTGLDRVYPAEHRELAARIAAGGALVSEFPTGTPPLAHNFPRRNRLMSGLARGVLVVEAAARSGSLITARLAGEQGREVMAVPGSIHNPLARGCHRLIRDGAALVESVDDVLAALGVFGLAGTAMSAPETSDGANSCEGTLDSDAEMLLNALGFEPSGLDRLVQRTGLSAHSVLSKLQLLELAGRVESLPGGRYGRTTARQAR